MYFQESEAIAAKYRDLRPVIESVDGRLAEIFSAAPLRTAVFSSVLGVDVNQIVSIFGLLEEQELLGVEEMVECEECQNLMPATAFHQAVEDEDRFECSDCGLLFHPSTQSTVIYQMTTSVLKRPRPDIPVNNLEVVLGSYARTENVFKREAHFWVVKFAGDMKFIKEERGMVYLARLLAEPHRDIPAACLLAAVAGIDPRITVGNSGYLLDDQAIAKYKERYMELEGELEEAKDRNDLGRVAKLQAERDAFTVEIARATGLAGKKRERTDIDRVRKAVSMAVTRAIDSIRDEHDGLGRHLGAFVSSGTVFRYAPEQDILWLT